jgi:two-component system, OmpR family, response regulator MtrA
MLQTVPAAKILFIEDDRRVRRATTLALEQEGYVVLEAADGDAGTRLLGERLPDVVILDVMLPGIDGFELCREIRKTSDVPILFLTARTDTTDVVVGLESGGDDYLTKPFEIKVLIARIRALLRRRRGGQAVKRIVAGDLEIEPEAGAVRVAGRSVALTKTEFELLRTLAARPNLIFTRERLLERVWGYDYLGDSRLVDVHVRRLRAKVESDPANPKLIQTVRGFGYKLATEA